MDGIEKPPGALRPITSYVSKLLYGEFNAVDRFAPDSRLFLLTGLRGEEIFGLIPGQETPMRHSCPFATALLPRLPFLSRAALVLALSLGLAAGLRAQGAIERIEDNPAQESDLEQGDILVTCWGMTVAALTPDLARQFQIDASRQGVVVTAVTPHSTAHIDTGMLPGDLIEEIGSNRITSVSEFSRATQRKNATLRLIVRQGAFSRIAFLYPVDACHRPGSGR